MGAGNSCGVGFIMWWGALACLIQNGSNDFFWGECALGAWPSGCCRASRCWFSCCAGQSVAGYLGVAPVFVGVGGGGGGVGLTAGGLGAGLSFYGV